MSKKQHNLRERSQGFQVERRGRASDTKSATKDRYQRRVYERDVTFLLKAQ